MANSQANAAAKPKHPVDVMEELYRETLIQTGKTLQAAARHGRGHVTPASAVVQTKMPAVFEKFHASLNSIETVILEARATLERDLQRVQARRGPSPAPVTAPATMSTPMAVAPPAPMVIDLESPRQGNASLSTSSAQISRPPAESRPVAPFPNMDFDLATSPEVAPATMPTPIMKNKEAKKNSPRPTALPAAAMGGRPSSAPARKEAKALALQASRSAASTPQQPPTSMPLARPKHAQSPAPAAASVAATKSENLFTSMAFSVELPPTEASDAPFAPAQEPGQLGKETVNKGPRHIDLTALRGSVGHVSGFSLEGVNGLSTMDLGLPGGGGGRGGHDGRDMANLDSKIEGLFDLGSADVDGMDIDYDLGGDGGSAKAQQFDDFFLADGNNHVGGNGFDFKF